LRKAIFVLSIVAIATIGAFILYPYAGVATPQNMKIQGDQSHSVMQDIIKFCRHAHEASEGDQLIILVAGYGWYWSIPPGQINNAELVAKALNGTVIEGAKVYSVVMPVTWFGALQPVVEAINELDPEIVLGIGTAGSTTCLRWEKYGCNWMTPYQDSAFPVPVSWDDYKPIDPNGPELHEVSFPYEQAALADLEAGIPAYVGSWYESHGRKVSTAGTYLCNYFTYTIPRYVEINNLDILAGFVHIPQRPEYRAMDYLEGRTNKIGPSMPIELTTEGVRIGLAEAIKAAFGPARFKFSDLTISPSEPELGQVVTVSVNVTNLSPGPFSRTCVVHLKLFGELKQTAEVVLAPGESKIVTFEIIPDSPCTYLVMVEGLVGLFTPTMPEEVYAEQLLNP